ncbi:hypothetical protein [Flexithrix dorotheae]|uniref:hypothetical protein n=1 Tax=Flexithrix dorotheae TaxID=70993 RepID=UPI0003787906|nr:hypothetical protein [Flexithrix dorotheae]
MARCEVKKGMFILKECSNFANQTCSKCSKSICSKHSTQIEDEVFCVECGTAKKKQQLRSLPARQRRNRNSVHDEEYERWMTDRNTHYGLWYYGIRDDFYHDSQYSPFDEQDYSGFDAESGQEFYDDTDSGGFMDS